MTHKLVFFCACLAGLSGSGHRGGWWGGRVWRNVDRVGRGRTTSHGKAPRRSNVYAFLYQFPHRSTETAGNHHSFPVGLVTYCIRDVFFSRSADFCWFRNQNVHFRDLYRTNIEWFQPFYPTIHIAACADQLDLISSDSQMKKKSIKVQQVFILLQKETSSVAERSFSIGTIAEIIQASGNAVVPFLQKLYPLFMKLVKDADDEVCSNAVFGLGCLCTSCGDHLTRWIHCTCTNEIPVHVSWWTCSKPRLYYEGWLVHVFD